MKFPLILGALALTACQPAPKPTAMAPMVTPEITPAMTESTTSSKSPARVEANSLLYAARGAKGLSNVTKNPLLKRAAQEHTAYMVATGQMSHDGRGGSNVRDRIQAQGYRGCFFAENIAKSQGDVADVFELWMNSTGHRANIEDRRATEYGIHNAGGYWTLVLASPC
jgi:uncharacterized protein YkwD